MELKTKYNTDQIFWAMRNDVPTEYHIWKIEITVLNHSTIIEYEMSITPGYYDRRIQESRFDDVFFPSKELLILSLLKNS